jgi:hypothetical protein
MENENNAKTAGKLQINPPEQMQFFIMIQLGKDCGEIFISHPQPERKYYPGQKTERTAEPEDHRDRKQVDEKDQGPEDSIFQLVFDFHALSYKYSGIIFDSRKKRFVKTT